jgi:hypothetical protein
MAQIVKLRRSSVSGQKPTNTTLQLGELALNTVDGKVFFAKSGSLGPTVEELVSTNTINTGSINISGSINLEGNQTITGSLYGTNIISGSQIWGDGSNLINIPLSGVTNLVTISGSFDNRINEITSSLDSINNFSSSVVLTSQTSSMTVMSASYALTASYALNASGGGGSALGSYNSLVVTEALSTWSFSHNTGQRYPIFQVFDNNGFVIIPSQIQTIDENNANIIFPSPQTGRVIASLGGGNGNTEEFLNSDLWVVDHNLGTDYPDVIIWDSNRNVIFPNRIESVNENQIKVYFSVPVSGHVSVSRGGHIISGSVDSDWASIANKPTGLVSGSGQITYSGINGVPSGIVSGSDQLTGSYDTRYVLSGSITQTTWDNIANKPVGIVSGSSQVEITGTTGYSTFSSSIDASISSSVSSLSSSIATTDLNQDNRLGSLETESGSIRGNFNTFTSSYTTGSFTGSFIGDGSQLYNIPLSGVTNLTTISGSIDSRLDVLETLSQSFTGSISGSITGSIYADYIVFNSSSAATLQSYMLQANTTDKTLDLRMGNNATLQLGQELYYPPIVNKSGALLPNGALVMFNPADPTQGNRISVVKCVSDGTYPAEYIVGILTEDTAINAEGFATWFGYVRDVSRTELESAGLKDGAETWTEGQILYPHPTRPGGLTNVQPIAPNLKSSICAITSINGINITFLVRPQLRGTLKGLHDVSDNTTTSTYGDLLVKSGSVWKNSKSLNGDYTVTGSLTITQNLTVLGSS